MFPEMKNVHGIGLTQRLTIPSLHGVILFADQCKYVLLRRKTCH